MEEIFIFYLWNRRLLICGRQTFKIIISAWPRPSPDTDKLLRINLLLLIRIKYTIQSSSEIFTYIRYALSVPRLCLKGVGKQNRMSLHILKANVWICSLNCCLLRFIAVCVCKMDLLSLNANFPFTKILTLILLCKKNLREVGLWLIVTECQRKGEPISKSRTRSV